MGEPSVADVLRRQIRALISRHDHVEAARTHREREHASVLLKGAVENARQLLEEV